MAPSIDTVSLSRPCSDSISSLLSGRLRFVISSVFIFFCWMYFSISGKFLFSVGSPIEPIVTLLRPQSQSSLIIFLNWL